MPKARAVIDQKEITRGKKSSSNIYLRKNMFDNISKHLEESWKYDALWCIFDKLWGAWKCGQTLPRVFDISSQWKLILKIKLSNKIIKVRDFPLSQGKFNNLKQSEENLVTTPLSKYHWRLEKNVGSLCDLSLYQWKRQKLLRTDQSEIDKKKERMNGCKRNRGH